MTKRKVLTVTALLVVALLVVLVVALLAVLGSAGGSRWALARIGSAVPGELAWQDVGGSLADGMRIGGLSFRGDGLDADVEALELAISPWRLLGLDLEIRRLEVRGVRVVLAPPTEEDSAPPVLADISLPLSVALRQARIEDLVVVQRPDVEQPILRVAEIDAAGGVDGASWQIDRLGLAGAEAAGTRLDVELGGALTSRGGYPLDLEVKWRVTAPDLASIAGGGRLRGSVAALRLEQTFGEPFGGELTGGIDGLPGSSDLDLALRLDGIDPRALNPEWPALSTDAEASLVGALDDYRLRLTGDFTFDDKAGSFELGGRGDAEHLADLELTLDALGGTTSAGGEVRWAPHAQAALRLDVRRLDPAAVWPDWPGRIDLAAAVEAVLPPAGADQERRLAVRDLDLGGELRDRPLAGAGTLVVDGARVRSPGLSLSWGAAEAELIGSGADADGSEADLDLRWRLSVPELAGLVPDAAGRVAADGTLRGPASTPRLDFEATASGLRLAGIAAESLTANARLELRGEDVTASAGEIELTAQGLAQGEQAVLDRLVAEVAGRLGEHRLELVAARDGRGLDLGLEGGWDGASWSGKVADAELRLAELADWRLEGPAALTAGAETARLDELCLSSQAAGAATACVEGSYAAGIEWRADARFSDLPLTLVKPFLEADLELDGSVDGTVEVVAVAGEPPTGTVHLEPSPGRLVYSPETGAPVALAHRGGRIDLVANAAAEVGGEVHLDLADAGSIDATFGLGPGTDGALRGDLALDLAELGWVRALMPEIADIGGRLVADFGFAGSRSAPRLDGRGQWIEGHLEMPSLGLSLRPIELRLTGEGGDQVELSAIVGAGDGRLEAVGGGSLRARTLRLEIAGERFPVAELPLAVSPDLLLVSDAEGLSLRGHAGLHALDAEAPATADRGRLDVDLAAAGAGAEAALRGGFELKMPDLGWLAALLPDLGRTAGRIDADLDLGGSLGAPLVSGRAVVAEGEVDLPGLGLELRHLQLEAKGGESGPIELAGTATSGGGELRIEGSIERDLDRASFLVRGDNAEVLDLPEATVRASPELELSLADNRLTVRGDVVVPAARIDLDESQPGVASSSDVVLVGGETEAEPGLEIDSRVRLVLGDDVRFEGSGVAAKLAGDLAVIDQPGKVTRGVGEVRLTEGTYKIYGQKLTLASGRLSFVGGPLSAPVVSLDATRKARDGVTAGVRVEGLLSSPTVQVYTDTPGTEDDALAYLVIGRPLTSSSSSSDSDLVQNAATSLGLSQGSRLARSVGSRLKIDDVRLERGGDLQDTRLFLGKQVSPRLYVAYGVGIFRAINTFLARYRLWPRWMLEARSGERTEVDLLYEFERGLPRRQEGEPSADAAEPRAQPAAVDTGG